MRFISPSLHGILDYSVAAALIGAPFLLSFADSSLAAAIISVAAGVGLVVYSLLTDYSASVRNLIPWRVHLALDTIAAVALLAAPFALGFGGVARGFYVTVALAVLAVVATTQVDVADSSEVGSGAQKARAAA
jgi:hypothetical protein